MRPNPTRRPKVVVIDEDPVVSVRVARLLKADHEVRVFDGARCALEWLTKSDDWDVILSDLVTTSTTGIDVYRGIEEAKPRRVHDIVFMVGEAGAGLRREILSDIECPIVDKAGSATELRLAIARAVTSR